MENPFSWSWFPGACPLEIHISSLLKAALCLSLDKRLATRPHGQMETKLDSGVSVSLSLSLRVRVRQQSHSLAAAVLPASAAICHSHFLWLPPRSVCLSAKLPRQLTVGIPQRWQKWYTSLQYPTPPPTPFYPLGSRTGRRGGGGWVVMRRDVRWQTKASVPAVADRSRPSLGPASHFVGLLNLLPRDHRAL